MAHDVLLAHGRKDERAVEGHADLPTVGVAGEHEVDELAARMLDDGVGVVGLVDHEDDGAVGLGGDGQVEVGVAGSCVVSAAEPDTRAGSFDGDVLVDEDGDSGGAERVDDERGADGDVVVAQDGVGLGGFEGGENLGAAVCGVAAGDEGE